MRISSLDFTLYRRRIGKKKLKMKTFYKAIVLNYNVTKDFFRKLEAFDFDKSALEG